jgi:hypothetical protein
MAEKAGRFGGEEHLLFLQRLDQMLAETYGTEVLFILSIGEERFGALVGRVPNLAEGPQVRRWRS